MDISIIFVSYNTAELTKKAINLVKQSVTNLAIEIFVIDNASKDNSVEMLKREFPEVHLITNNQNVGFGRANNQALATAKGEYILLVNTDAFVEPDTIQKTYDFMQKNPSTGILGVKLLGRDGVLQPSCRYFNTPWNVFLHRTGLDKVFKCQMVDDFNWDHASVRHCDWVPGCYYMVRRKVIDQVGLFDPRYFLYYEEVDHCFATKKMGWQVTYYPDTTVVHIGGESAKSDNKITTLGKQVSSLQIESELIYIRKNFGLLMTIVHLILFNISAMIIIAKQLIKSRFDFKQIVEHKNLSLFWKLFFSTNMGSKPLH
jgi:N-acetylglucosaminyl-diphospho-decaprenol L-rhamnosyltransferase